MKTIATLEKQIFGMTEEIRESFPELSKYILEMPENNTEGKNVTIESLEAYYQSLVAVKRQYAESHKEDQ